MKRGLLPLTLALGALIGLIAPVAPADEPGAFDYYVLALSWNASWCEAEGDARDAPQCAATEDHGWLLHGLWPQYASGGWPEYCAPGARDPGRADTGAMADIMGSGGLAWHQWKKHGRCSGLEAAGYFGAAREAYGAVRRPALLRQLEETVRIAPEVVEEAFLEANPELDRDGVVVTCKEGRIAEVRLCLDRALAPRPCGADVAAKACRGAARLPAMR